MQSYKIMILKVPYYSQIKDTKNPDWKNKACGVTALKMVLDFYGAKNQSIDDLYQKGLDIGGYLEDVGWYHHSLALLAKQFGFRAITRSWNIPKESLVHLKKRGFSPADIAIVNRQQLEEALFSLKNELDHQHPVILSVPKGLAKNSSGHLVVLTGYDENSFILNDPFGGEGTKLDYNKFKNIWAKRAVIIYPKLKN